MTREQAIEKATDTAKRENIVMVVTFNEYDEAENEDDKYSYFPEDALERMHRIGAFKFDKVVETIKPPGAKT